MPRPNPDVVRAIEARMDVLVRAFQKTDISSLSELLTDTAILMQPERPTAKGRAVSDRLRQMAQRVEAFKLLSTDIQALGDAHVCDVGTLSLRHRQSGTQSILRYLMIWEKDGSEWKLTAMTWNREDANVEGRRAAMAGADRARVPTGAYRPNDGLGDM